MPYSATPRPSSALAGSRRTCCRCGSRRTRSRSRPPSRRPGIRPISHGGQQVRQAFGPDAQLHEPVGVAFGVVQRDADVLAQLAGHVVGLRLLDSRARRPAAAAGTRRTGDSGSSLSAKLVYEELVVCSAPSPSKDVQVLHLQHVGKLLQPLLRLTPASRSRECRRPPRLCSGSARRTVP